MLDDVLELTIAFETIPPDIADPWPVRFSVCCLGVGSWEGGQFTNPLDDKETLDAIRWYLEEYPEWPSAIDRERARQVEVNLERWGRDLFNALFGHPAAARIYQAFLASPASQRRMVIEASSPQVQRLPWELMTDRPGHLFARWAPLSISRRVRLAITPPLRTFDLPLRVLMVTSRPEGIGPAGPCSVVRGVLNALAPLIQAGRVAVDLLRPPTLAALDKALRKGNHEGRPYHIVHFDGHGVYHPQTGLGQLAFERDDGSLDLVDASRMGVLLQECGVLLVMLNACRSAQGDQTRLFSSVAARLLEAGVGGVLSMSYSVSVATAGRFVQTLYRALVEGRSVVGATDEARRALIPDFRHLLLKPERSGAWSKLHDWFLPVLYQQQADGVPFSCSEGRSLPVTKDEKPDPSREAVLHRSTVLYGLPPEPLYGFVGRARELLALERLFRDYGIIVLHGGGGSGKTALATEAARWFTRTGLFHDAVFVSFDQCQSADYALTEIGRALVEPTFHAGQDGDDPVGRVAEKLRARPTLIIFDHFERAMGKDALLGPDDLRLVLEAAKTWAGVAGSRVLITTRSRAFGDAALAPGKLAAHLELKGLSVADALLLATEILKHHGVDRRQVLRDGLERLLALLDAYPLSLELVLPRLRACSVDQLVQEFGALLVEFRHVRGEKCDESLMVSLEMSLRWLSDDARAHMPDLAVFQGGAFEIMIYGGAGATRITDMDEATWRAVRAELSAVALLSAEELPGVTVPFIRFHPTLLSYLREDLPFFSRQEGEASRLQRVGGILSVGEGGEVEGMGEGGRRAELEARYRQGYCELATVLLQADTKAPLQARAIAAWEMPNLRRALDLTLAAGEFDAAASLAERLCRFLEVLGRWRERDRVLQAVSSKRQEMQCVTHDEVLAQKREADALLRRGRAAEAEQVLRGLLARPEHGAAFETGCQRARVLGSIGRCLMAQGHPGEAVAFHRQSLDAWAQLEQTGAVRQAAGVEHTGLADALTELGHYAEAQTAYEAALDIARVHGDERSVAAVLTQLGTLALRQGDLAEARRRYLEALRLDLQVGNPRDQAIDWHQLGMVAHKAGEWGEAERCYKESLALEEHLGDKAGAAQTCNQLAMVAKRAGRPIEAERWYRRAIALGEQLNYVGELGKCYNNLASLLLDQGRLDEAEQYARRAVETVQRHGIATEVWKMYALLADIAEQRGWRVEARAWRRKEQETFAAFAGSGHQVQPFQPLVAAIVRAAQGEAQAGQQIELWLRQMETADQMSRRFAASIRRILAGDRTLAALTVDLDHISAFVVRQVLDRLTSGAPTSTVSQTSAISSGREEGFSVEQLVELVGQALDGNRALGTHLVPTLQALARDLSAPRELRALFDVLFRLLTGERELDLSALPPEMAERVQSLRTHADELVHVL